MEKIFMEFKDELPVIIGFLSVGLIAVFFLFLFCKQLVDLKRNKK
jgi:hypothetical protein